MLGQVLVEVFRVLFFGHFGYLAQEGGYGGLTEIAGGDLNGYL